MDERQRLHIVTSGGNNDFEKVCISSRHLLPGQKCRGELFSRGRKSSKPSMEGDVLKVYDLLKRVGVFQDYDTPREIKENSIWKCVRQQGKISPAKWHTAKAKVETTAHEKKVLQMLFDKSSISIPVTEDPNQAEDPENNSISSADESAESIAESIASVASDTRSLASDASNVSAQEWADEAATEIDDLLTTMGDICVEDGDLTNEEIRERARRMIMNDEDDENENQKTLEEPKELAAALKKNHTGRKHLNRQCIKNQFEVGRDKLKDIVKERKRERDKLERKIKLVYDSVKHFREYQEKEMENLDQRAMNVEADEAREVRSWEANLNALLSTFNMDTYYESNIE